MFSSLAAKRRREAWTSRAIFVAGPHRVLVVDDNLDVADSLREVLKLKGLDARSVYLGELAVVVAKAWLPCLVLLDISLSDISGIEVARRIRATPGCEDTILFAHTALDAGEIREEAKAAGFDAFVGQPAAPGQIVEAFERYCPSVRSALTAKAAAVPPGFLRSFF